MRKSFLQLKSVLIAFTVVVIVLLSSGCSKDVATIDNTDEYKGPLMTRAGNWHWLCKKCAFINNNRSTKCLACGMEKSPEHSQLMFSLISYPMTHIELTLGEGFDPNSIEVLPNYFTPYAPPPWYETSAALQYYNAITSTLLYMSDRTYAEGVDYAWYRTVRCLYPAEHDPLKVENMYQKFKLSGYSLLDMGMKAGTTAAIKAYLTYKGSPIPPWL